MRKKWIFSFTTTLVLTIFLSTTVLAATTSTILSITSQKQEKENWCWAASSQMLLGYYGTTVTQSNFVKTVKGSVVDTTANSSEVQSGLSSYGLATTNTGTLNISALSTQLDQGDPVLAGYFYKNISGGHMVVIRGYYNSVTTTSTNQLIYYVDPYPSNDTWNTMSYSTFLSNSNWYWSVSLYH